MQFSTAEQRSAYFSRIENGEYPAYGSAMEHASTVRLGLFGDSLALQKDCAKIFLGELYRFSEEFGIPYIRGRFTANFLVRRSSVFRKAFTAARVIVAGTQHNELAAFIEGLQPDARTTLTDEEQEALCEVHEKVLREFRIPFPAREKSCPQST